jgi:hypothetical protein
VIGLKIVRIACQIEARPTVRCEFIDDSLFELISGTFQQRIQWPECLREHLLMVVCGVIDIGDIEREKAGTLVKGDVLTEFVGREIVYDVISSILVSALDRERGCGSHW